MVKIYRKEALIPLVQFIDENYESRNQIIFWPDLATCHYTIGKYSSEETVIVPEFAQKNK